MNGDIDEKQDFAALKKLLSSWHVEILYDLFQAEDIAIEELKMMQFCHINSLLKNYKMGVRIRFEHHFINWRNRIGLPLKEIETNRVNTCCCHFNKPIFENRTGENSNNNVIVTESKSKKRRTTLGEIEDTQPPLSPDALEIEKSLNKIATVNEVSLTSTQTVSPPAIDQTNHNDEEGEKENCTRNTPVDFLETTLEEPPNFPSKPIPQICTASLKQILELSGTRGMSIINFYNEEQHLTNVHRVQLMQIIVDFFDENDYHLSLNMSHNLEWEILKMFPSEKLEYYRTEKRGKIYVKFANLKRYKRDRNNKTNTETETTHTRPRRSINRNHQLNGFIVENNTTMDMDNDDTDWSESAETKIEIKKENIETI